MLATILIGLATLTVRLLGTDWLEPARPIGERIHQSRVRARELFSSSPSMNQNAVQADS